MVIDEEYVREVSAAYWEEEAEMKAGIHPTQIKERLKKELYAKGIYQKITFMNYLDGGIVRASLGNSGIYVAFDYINNQFVAEEIAASMV